MDDLVDQLGSMNSEQLQAFCLADAEKDESDALVLEYELLDMIGDQINSDTFGDEDEETPTEAILRMCVEAMDIPTTVGMILMLRDSDSEDA